MLFSLKREWIKAAFEQHRQRYRMSLLLFIFIGILIVLYGSNTILITILLVLVITIRSVYDNGMNNDGIDTAKSNSSNKNISIIVIGNKNDIKVTNNTSYTSTTYSSNINSKIITIKIH